VIQKDSHIGWFRRIHKEEDWDRPLHRVIQFRRAIPRII